MSKWTTSDQIMKYALVKSDSLNYIESTPFRDQQELEDFITNLLIPRAQGHINAYCARDFDVDYPSAVPEAIKDVCARAGANMVQYLVLNKSGPTIKVSDYRISIPKQDVLTVELRELLAPWVSAGGGGGVPGHPVTVRASKYQTGLMQDREGNWET